MKAFTALLVAVLVAIGIGVGVESVTTSSHPLAARWLATSSVPTPNTTCPGNPIALSARDVVPQSDLAAVSFFSANDGVGITTSEIQCQLAQSSRTTERTFPIRLTQTANGGRTWKLLSESSPPNVRHVPYQSIAMVFASTQQGWLSANGRIEHTIDGGRHWTSVHFDGQPVAAISRADNSLLVLTSLDMHLWSMSLSTDHWSEGTPVPTVNDIPSVPTPFIQTALGPNPNEAVVATAKYGDVPPEITTTNDGGMHWTVRSDPCKTPTWVTLQALSEASDGAIAVLCGGGAAAGSATRGFYVSTTRGASWTEEASDTDLAGANVSDIPLQDFGDALLAESSTRYVLAFANGCATSTDGGTHWSSLPIAEPLGSTTIDLLGAGGESTYDVLDAKHMWMLVPGVGIFRTLDNPSIWTSMLLPAVLPAVTHRS